MAHVVEEPGDPEGLDDEPLRRDAVAGPGRRPTRRPTRRDPGALLEEPRAERRIEMAGPPARLVHDSEAVGEARVLGGREDPPSTLELRDAAQALEPGRVEEVLLGDGFGRQAGGRRFGR